MKNDLFVNRKDDFEKIKQEVYKDFWHHKTKGIIIFSKSGIGKSRFVEELFNREFSDYIKIKVEVRGNNKAVVDNLYFIKRLYDKVISAVEPNGRISLLKKLRMASVNSLSLGLKAGVVNVSLNPALLQNTHHDALTLRMFKYLTKTLCKDGKHKYIIDFENFHLVDEESFHFLTYLFKLSTYNCYIFEYTISQSSDERKLKELQNRLNQHIDCKLYQLEKLNLNELEKICQNVEIDFEVAKEFYEKEQGDLLSISMLNQIKKSHETNDAIKNVIEELSEDETFIMNLVALNKATIKKSQLYKIFSDSRQVLAGNRKFTLNYLREIMKQLIEKRMLLETDDTIHIYHDLILKKFEEFKANSFVFTAYSLLKEFYLSHLSIPLYEENAVLMLLHLYSVFSDPEIAMLIPNIKKVLLQQRYPSAIVETMQRILDGLSYKNNNKSLLELITLEIVDISFSIGDWKTALKNLDTIYSSKNPIHIAYRSALIASDINSPSTEEKLKSMIEENSINCKLELFINLCLLTYYMELHSSGKPKKFAEKLIQQYKGSSSKEYAFLLKDYTEYLGNTDALKTLDECMNIFREHNRADLVHKCIITYASRLVYLGFLDEALEKLGLAEKGLKETHYRQHYFLNNTAAINMLKGAFTLEVEQNLQEALILTTSEYEKSIVLCNLLIYYTMTKNMEDAKQIVQSIESADVAIFGYEELKHIVSFNLLYYYNTIQNPEKAEQYVISLRTLASDESTGSDLKEYIISSLDGVKLSSDHQWYYYSKLPYRPDFIGYWLFEVGRDF